MEELSDEDCMLLKVERLVVCKVWSCEPFQTSEDFVCFEWELKRVLHAQQRFEQL